MKIYLGNVGKLDYIRLCRENNYGICYIASDWRYPKPGIFWFLDNGAFSYWKKGIKFDERKFLEALWKIESCNSLPDFIVTPDIVAGGLASLDYSLQWLDAIPSHHPVYLAVQDGMIQEDIEDHIPLFDGLFLGGTPDWKWQTAGAWVNYAHSQGKPCHIGQVGKYRYILRARALGADSVDSSTIAQADNSGPYGQYKGFRRLEAVKKQATLDTRSCEYCGIPIYIGDERGSAAYQAHYRQELMCICDKCCTRILKRAKNSMWNN